MATPSSLQAQLAALSGASGKHPGSYFTPSSSNNRRHDEARGRGMHFSVQAGQHIRPDPTRFQPSLLYASAKEAAEISMDRLAEVARSSIQELATLHPPILELLATLNHNASQTMPLTKTADETWMRRVLIMMGSLLGETGGSSSHSNTTAALDTSIAQNAWQVLEYLLRRYQLHVHHMPDLLWTILPHAEQFPQQWQRCLELVDLSSSHSYLWLRPYVADTSSSTQRSLPPPPPRQVVTKNLMKHVDLIRTLSQLASGLAQAHVEEQRPWGEPPRRGIALVLSYTAALLVEGLSWLQRQPHTESGRSGGGGNMDREVVLRTLLPWVLSAVSAPWGSCLDWTGWGYVLTSTLAETMPLSMATVETLTRHIMAPAALLNQDEEDDDHEAALMWQADAVTAVLSLIFVQHHPPPLPSQSDGLDPYLPLLHKPDTWLGCGLSWNMFQALTQLSTLPEIVGLLHRDRGLIMAPFLASLVVVAYQSDDQSLSMPSAKQHMPDHDNVQGNQPQMPVTSVDPMIQEIIQEPKLRTLWEDPDLCLVASVASWVIQVCLSKPATCTRCRLILQELHQLNRGQCEKGMAHGVQQSTLNNTSKRKLVKELFHSIVPAMLLEEDSDQVDAAREGFLLPPRVALEHAEPLVRLEAIKKLSLRPDPLDDRSDLTEAFLRRWSVEENCEVAQAVCQALVALVAKDALAVTKANSSLWAETVLCGFQYWFERSSRHSKIDRLIMESLPLLGYVARGLVGLGGEVALLLYWQRLVECLVAQLSPDDRDVRIHVVEAILLAFDRSMPSDQKNDAAALPVVAGLLFDHEHFIRTVKEFLFNAAKMHHGLGARLPLCRQCALVIVNVLSDHVDDGLLAARRSEVFDLCVLFLSTSSSAVKGSNLESVVRCVDKVAKLAVQSVEERLTRIVTVASTDDSAMFDRFGISTIQNLAAGVQNCKGRVVPAILVLLECALRTDTLARAALRLVEAAAREMTSDGLFPIGGLVYALGIFGTGDQKLREAVVAIIKKISGCLAESGPLSSWRSISKCCTRLLDKSRIDGCDLLSSFLRECCHNKLNDGDQLQRDLLAACVATASTSYGSPGDDSTWMSLDTAPGACRSVTVLLNAMELSGEGTFPLALRWSLAGRPLFDKMRHLDSLVDYTRELACCVVKMLRGLTIVDPLVIISSQPGNGGGRKRSYSFGKTDGAKIISPYPSDMCEAITESFAMQGDGRRETMSNVVASDALQSDSWKNIYSEIPSPIRNKLAAAFFRYFANSPSAVSEDCLISFPFAATEITNLLENVGTNNYRLLSKVTEFVNANAETLATGTSGSNIVPLLFRLVDKVTESRDELDLIDALCGELLVAIDAMLKHALRHAEVSHRPELSDWGRILLLIIGEKAASNLNMFSWHTKAIAIGLVVSLCSVHPEIFADSLIRAVTSVCALATTGALSPLRAEKALADIVPVFCRHAVVAGLSLVHLFVPFIEAVQLGSDAVMMLLYRGLALSILGWVDDKIDAEPAGWKIGGFAASIIASAVARRAPDRHHQPLHLIRALEVVKTFPLQNQLEVVLKLCQYVGSLVESLGSDASTLMTTESTTSTSRGSTTPRPVDILAIAVRGLDVKDVNVSLAISRPTDEYILLLRFLLNVIQELLRTEGLTTYVKKGAEASTETLLRLWQEILVSQSAAHAYSPPEPILEGWNSILAVLDENQSLLQDILPTPIFLASVESLMNEGNPDVVAKAFRLVSDRVLAIVRPTHELSLFVDLLPVIVATLQVDERDWSQLSENGNLDIFAFATIEHIARAYLVNEGKQMDPSPLARQQIFATSLENMSRVLDFLALIEMGQTSSDKTFDEHSSKALDELSSAAALCCATLVRIVGIPCLPIIPKLGEASSILLSIANTRTTTASGDSLETLKLLQLSLLRAFISIIETVPQFAAPLIPRLFDEESFLSPALRVRYNDRSNDDDVLTALETIDDLVTSRIPPRLLIPAASKAFHACSSPGAKGLVLRIMQRSIQEASSGDAQSTKKLVFDVAVGAFDYKATQEEHRVLIYDASELLTDLVMKISEVQLRRFYAALREWRGNLDNENSDGSAGKRLSFWVFSSSLCDRLRSIFLPCLNMIFDDLVSELTLAASMFHGGYYSKESSKGKKRRKIVASDFANYGVPSMMVLLPLLRCLESALRADAHDGGNWIRNDDKRWDALLRPLSKLLVAHIPPNFPVPVKGIAGFNFVVEGVANDSGSVISCLNALAAAGGNDQLWKPLNHAVLEACSDEGRLEVRRAGLKCLKSLMKSFGEEYMVLLPECLPVLAELLEDTEENIAAVAREIVSLAEETLGESLEDSLR